MAGSSLNAVLHFLRRCAGERLAHDLSDADLLGRFTAQQDETAFATLLQRHGAMVWDLCRHILQHEQDAEDAFQATFLVLARRAGSIRKQEALAAWLHGVAYRIAHKARTASARRRRHEKEVANMAQPNASAPATEREARAAVHEELQKLPARYRSALVLFYLEGKSYEETARQLKCRLGTVKSRLARGRELLRSRLARRGLLGSAGAIGVGLAPASAMPAKLLPAAVKAAVSFAAGKATAGIVSAQAMALAQGALQAMMLTKMKAIAVILVLFGIVAAGATVARHDVPAEKTGESPPPALTKKEPPNASIAHNSAADAKGERTDLYGDPLPPGVLARVGSVCFHHGDLIYSAMFAPDGKALISGARDGTIRVWDSATGKEVRRLPVDADVGAASPLSISRDGKTAAVGDYGGTIQVFDIPAGKRLHILQIGKKDVRSVALSPDGKTLVVGIQENAEKLTISLLDSNTGRELRRLWEHQGKVRSLKLAMAADGTIICSASDRTLRLWDLHTGKALHRLDGHEGEVRALAFSPDGQIIVSGGHEGTIRVWSVSTGKELRRQQLVKKNRHGVTALAFSPDGATLAAACSEEKAREWSQIQLWDVAEWKEKRRMTSSQFAPISSLAFSPDGKRLASDGGRTLYLWDVATGKELDHERQREVTWLALARDGKVLATTSSHGVIDLWEVASGRRIRQLPGHGGSSPIVFSAGGRHLVSSDSDRTIRVWEVESGREIRRLPHPDRFEWAAFAPGGRMLAGTRGPVIQLWDLSMGKEVRRLTAQVCPRPAGIPDWGYFPFYCLKISPDGRVVAAGEQYAPVSHLWDLATGKEMRRVQGHKPAVSGLAFSPDSRFLVTNEAYGQGPLYLWDVATGRQVRQFGSAADAFGPELAFSPDGRTLVAGRRSKVLPAYEVATGQVRHTFEGHQGEVLDAAFSADGTILVTTSWDSTALVWDLAGRLQQRKLSRAELEARWAALAGTDAARAYQAIRALAGSPTEAVAFLSERLPPIMPADPKQMKSLLADLGSGEFARRQSAAAELERLGFKAEPALRQTLADEPNLEARRRIESLLAKLDKRETLRIIRAIEALELIATDSARRHLRALAAGAAAARLTQEASAAVERLARRAGEKAK